MAGDVQAVQRDARVSFHPLYFRTPDRAGEEWIVGHEPSDTAITLPESGIVAIKRLQAGVTFTEAAEAVRRQCGEDIDIGDLVEGLAGVGFVASLDGQRLPEPERIGQRWLSRIPSAWAGWLYSPLALTVWVCVALAGPLVLMFDPAIRPQARDLLWSDSYAVDILTLIVIAPLLLVKHELGHLLAGRAQGLAAELTFGHRLIYLVAVSRVAGVWKLSRWKRLVIYSAGMLNDLVWAGAGTLLLALAQARVIALSTQVEGLIGLLILSEYVGVAWEFQVFLKTDVYHIMADLTGRHDLPERARLLLYTVLRRLQELVVSRRLPVAGVSNLAEDEGASFDWLDIGYTSLAVIGIGGTLIWFLVYLLPANITAIVGAMTRVAIGFHTGQALALLDGVVALGCQGVFWGLLVWSWLKGYRKHSRQRHVSSTL